MVPPVPVPAHPELSVIVPARNEEATLGACLDSLVNQSGLQYEIIVVDDASTDRTRQIAQSYSQVAVISAGPLPTGATGKNSALVAGAHHAQGNWLLFTDADTVHRADSLLRSLTEARNRQVDLLSYSPEQEVRTFWEKAIMPVIFSELAAWYRPAEVSDPQMPAAAANGQFILARRDAYDAIGGHAAIAGEVLEDVALARRFKRAGYKSFFDTAPISFAPACTDLSPPSAKDGRKILPFYFLIPFASRSRACRNSWSCSQDFFFPHGQRSIAILIWPAFPFCSRSHCAA